MALIRRKPTSPGRRAQVYIKSDEVSSRGVSKPEKSLTRGKGGPVGRAKGKVSTRHRQQGAKKLFRAIDFKRKNVGVSGIVIAIEYDPNRSANIALIYYKDGSKAYILAPIGLKVGQSIVAGDDAPIRVGNALKIAKIPEGTIIHNIEITPGKGAQMVRSAGVGATILSKEDKFANVKMPSGEVRRVFVESVATIGQVGNIEHKNRKIGKAGRNRHLGKRPNVRGVAMAPNAHPHGGGEGRSGIGMSSPKSPWGKKTLGKKTRRRTHTDKFIVKRSK